MRVKIFAAGLLTWVALAAQDLAVYGVKREPWIQSEAGENPNSSAPGNPGGLQVRSGAALQVRLDRSLSTAQNRAGDRFTATLVDPIQIDGTTGFPKGSQITGVVEESAPSGRFKGRAYLMLALESIQIEGRELSLSTTVKSRSGPRHRNRNSVWIGGGSGAGAMLGGLAAGPIGMAIGASSGAAAGFAGSLVTGRKQVRIPAETLLTFRLRAPVDVPPSGESPRQQGNSF